MTQKFFKTNKELQDKIDDYFKNCPDTTVVTTKNSESITVPCYTITGLAYHLGFASRQSFYDYEKNEEHAYTIKRARLFIEKEYEKALRTGNAGVIFALKNFGWVDKQEVTQTTRNVVVNSQEDKDFLEKI